MAKYYMQHFKDYIAQLQKLEQKTVAKTDLIVEQAQSMISLNSLTFGMLGNSPAKKQKSAFVLGDRFKILENIESCSNPINVSAAVDANEKYPYEMLFYRYDVIVVITYTSY